MKKRFSGILLSLALMLTMIPALSLTAYADDPTIVNNEKELLAALENGGSVKLGADITFNNQSELRLHKAIELDLNGKTLTKAPGDMEGLDLYAPMTIKDGSIEGGGVFNIFDVIYAYYIYKGGSLTLESGTLNVTGHETRGIIAIEGPFTMTGGTIKSDDNCVTTYGGDVNISDGTLIGLRIFGDSNIYITGGRFSFDPTSQLSEGYIATKDGDYWVVKQAPVSYMDWDDTGKKFVEKTGDDACKSYTIVTDSTRTWGVTGQYTWYVVNHDVNITGDVSVNGEVNLIICDGKTLTVNGSIGSDGLTIYTQSTGEKMGTLNSSGGISCYEVKINGGTVTAATSYEDGIFAYRNVTINGGNVTASGSNEGIHTEGFNNGAVTINGGSVTASGNRKAIDGKVKNAIAGTGWTNTAGTEGEADIAARPDGQELAFKKVQFVSTEADDVSAAIADIPEDLSKTDKNTIEQICVSYELLADPSLISDDEYIKLYEAKMYFDKKDAKAGKVKLTKATAGKGRKATAKWKKGKDFSGYQLYYKAKNVKAKKASTTKTTRTVSKLKAGKTYSFKVRPFTYVFKPIVDDGVRGFESVKVYGKWSNVKKAKAKK